MRKALEHAWKYEYGGHCLICSKACPDKRSIDCTGWDWFGGYLRVTVHFCPQHRTGDLRDRLLAIGEKHPDRWTLEERAFVAEFKLELDRLESAATRRESVKRKKS
jgi:hypothetical protein